MNIHSANQERKSIMQTIKEILFKYFEVSIKSSEVPIILMIVLLLCEFYTILFYQLACTATAFSSYPIDWIQRIFFYTKAFDPGTDVFLIAMIIIMGIIILFFTFALVLAGVSIKSMKIKSIYKLIILISFYFSICSEKIMCTVLIHSLIYLKGVFPNFIYEDGIGKIDLQSFTNTPNQVLGIIYFTLIIILILIWIIHLIFTRDSRVFGSCKYCFQEYYFHLLKLLLKIVFGIINFLDTNYKTTAIWIVITAIIIVGTQLLRIGRPAIKHFFLYYSNICGEFIILLGFIVAIINQNATNSFNLDLCIYLFAILIPFSFSQLEYYYKYNLIMIEFKSLNEIQSLLVMRIIISLIPSINKNDQYGLMSSIIFNHSRSCESQNCISHTLVEIIYKQEKNKFIVDKTTLRPKNKIDYKLLENEKILPMHLKSYFTRTEIHKFITILFQEIYARFPRSSDLYILHANYEFDLTNHILISLQMISNSEKVKPSILNQFDIFSIKNEIQNEMNIANRVASREIPHYIDCSKLLQFNKSYSKVIDMTEKCTENVVKFWQNLMSERVNSNDLMKIGENLYKSYELFEEKSQKLLDKSKMNINLVYRIAMFKRMVMHRERDAESLFKDMFKYFDVLLNSQKNQEKLKKNCLGKAIIMKINGEKDHLGEVLEASIDAEKVLLYKRNEIMGRNISNFQPPIIAKFHPFYMDNLINTMNPRILSTDYPILIKTGQGHYQNAIKYVKILSSIANGINFCVIIYSVPFNVKIKGRTLKLLNEPAIFFAESDAKIFGINKSCEKIFGISAASVNQNSFSLFNIFSELNQETEQTFMNEEGYFFESQKGNLGEIFINEYSNPNEEAALKNENIQKLWGKIENIEIGNKSVGISSMKILYICNAEEFNLKNPNSFNNPFNITNLPAFDQIAESKKIEETKNKEFNSTSYLNRNECGTAEETGKWIQECNSDLKIGEAKTEMPIIKFVQSISKLNYFILVSLTVLIILILIISILSISKISTTNYQMNIVKYLALQNEIVIYANNVAYAMYWIPSYYARLKDIDKKSKSIDALKLIQKNNIDKFLDYYSQLENFYNDYPDEYRESIHTTVFFNEESLSGNNHTTKNSLNTALIIYLDHLILLLNLEYDDKSFLSIITFISNCNSNSFLGILESNFKLLENNYTKSLLQIKTLLLILIICGISLTIITAFITILRSLTVIRQKSHLISIFALLNLNEIRLVAFQAQCFDAKSININKKLIKNPGKLYYSYKLTTQEKVTETGKKGEDFATRINETNNLNQGDSIVEFIDPNLIDLSNSQGDPNLSVSFQKENEEFARYQSKIAMLGMLNTSLLLRVALKVIFASLLIMGCFAVNIYLVINYFNTFSLIVNFFESLVTRRWNLNAEYLLLFNALMDNSKISKLTEPLTSNYSYEYYYNGSLSTEDIIAQLNTQQSSIISNFLAFTNQVDSSSFCNILNPETVSNFQTEMCNSGMGMFYQNGMRNLIFRILQINIQMKLNIITKSITKDNLTENGDFISSWSFQVYAIDPLLNKGFNLFIEDLDYNLYISKISQGILLGGTIVIIIICYFAVFNIELSNLQNEIIICKDLLMLIPSEIAHNNTRINKFFTTGDSKILNEKISEDTNKINIS